MPAGASVAERIDHLTKFEEGDVELLVASQFTCKWRPCIIYGTPQIEPGASHAQKTACDSRTGHAQPKTENTDVEKFLATRQLSGHPVTIVDTEAEFDERVKSYVSE